MRFVWKRSSAARISLVSVLFCAILIGSNLAASIIANLAFIQVARKFSDYPTSCVFALEENKFCPDTLVPGIAQSNQLLLTIALGIQPNLASAYSLLGTIALYEGQDNVAVKSYESAYIIRRDWISGWKSGLSMLAQGDEQAAILRWFESGIVPKDLTSIGEGEKRLGDLSNALRWYQLAARMDPQHSSGIHVRMATLLRRLGRADEARAEYATALGVDGGWDSEQQRYDALLRRASDLRYIGREKEQSDLTGAAADFQQALALISQAAVSPVAQNEELIFLRGQILLEQGDLRSAAGQFRQLTIIDENNSTAFLYWGYALYPNAVAESISEFAWAAHLDTTEQTTGTVCAFFAKRHDWASADAFLTLLHDRPPTEQESQQCVAASNRP